jgi:hypothetical protein
VAWWNSYAQRQLEESRAVAARDLERDKDLRNVSLEANKAEGARILEMIKTGTDNPDKAAKNLSFLVEIGLATDKDGRIKNYLTNRRPGEGTSLPAPGAPAPVEATVADLESENTTARRAARRILAQLGAAAIPAITDLLAKNRNLGNPNYRQVLGAVEALAEMNQADRCAAYKKDAQLQLDVQKHAGISEESLNAAAARALKCP